MKLLKNNEMICNSSETLKFLATTLNHKVICIPLKTFQQGILNQPTPPPHECPDGWITNLVSDRSLDANDQVTDQVTTNGVRVCVWKGVGVCVCISVSVCVL